MKKTVMENKEILVEAGTSGGELCRIYNKNKEQEVLWNADPAFWGRHAPILFPMVGESYKKEYRVDGTVYPMTSHGFARDMEFELLSESDAEVWYVLESSEATLSKYPFPFRLELGYRLSGSTVLVLWKLKNTGFNPMHFGIGAHPAFRIPAGETLTSLKISFSAGLDSLDYIQIEDPGCGCALPQQVMTLPLHNGITAISSTFFDKGAYIFENGSVKEAAILLSDGTPYVTVRCGGFPEFGLWTKAGHPFLCLEPWYGRCDDIGYTGELKDKAKVRTLGAGSIFEASYEIILR